MRRSRLPRSPAVVYNEKPIYDPDQVSVSPGPQGPQIIHHQGLRVHQLEEEEEAHKAKGGEGPSLTRIIHVGLRVQTKE